MTSWDWHVEKLDDSSQRQEEALCTMYYWSYSVKDRLKKGAHKMHHLTISHFYVYYLSRSVCSKTTCKTINSQFLRHYNWTFLLLNVAPTVQLVLAQSSNLHSLRVSAEPHFNISKEAHVLGTLTSYPTSRFSRCKSTCKKKVKGGHFFKGKLSSVINANRINREIWSALMGNFKICTVIFFS